ncbi:hypothetical protein OSTOST_09632 [Ostertagia ostertagi]
MKNKFDSKDNKPLHRKFSIAPPNVNTFPTGVDFIEPKVIQFINNIRTTQPPFRKQRPNGLRPQRPGSNPNNSRIHPRFRPTPPPSPPQPQPSLKKPLRPKQPPQTNVPQPSPAQPTCGVAPEFSPCVSSEQASHGKYELHPLFSTVHLFRFVDYLQLCWNAAQRKNLPAGCLSLCRYDITQAEVRLGLSFPAFCGRPTQTRPYFGPQCEQFCRPAQGLSALGLQHIVCANAIGDMLHCHHAGIRR